MKDYKKLYLKYKELSIALKESLRLINSDVSIKTTSKQNLKELFELDPEKKEEIMEIKDKLIEKLEELVKIQDGMVYEKGLYYPPSKALNAIKRKNELESEIAQLKAEIEKETPAIQIDYNKIKNININYGTISNDE